VRGQLLSRKSNTLFWATYSSSPINAGKLTRRCSSPFLCSACLARFAPFPQIGCIALFCGSPPSIVSRLTWSLFAGHRLTVSSYCVNLHLHCPTHSHAEQTKPEMGLYHRHGWLWLGQSGIFIPSWVRRLTHYYMKTKKSKLLIVRSFLSVAWTMTDYDGTTQYVSPMSLTCQPC
jgi:hypothetical protein